MNLSTPTPAYRPHSLENKPLTRPIPWNDKQTNSIGQWVAKTGIVQQDVEAALASSAEGRIFSLQEYLGGFFVLADGQLN